MLTQNDAKHIFQALRSGLVPERGLDALAVGVEKPRDELKRQLELDREDALRALTPLVAPGNLNGYPGTVNFTQSVA